MKSIVALLLFVVIAGGAWLWITDREKAEELVDSIAAKADQVSVATTQAVQDVKPKLEQAKAAATQAADKIHRATTQAIEDAGPYLERVKAATTQAAEQVRKKVTGD